MKKRIVFLTVVVLLAGLLPFVHQPVSFAAETVQKAKGKYHCPMHPDYVSDKKGTCPICGMDLVKNDDEPEVAPGAPANKGERKVLFYRNPMDPSVTSPVFMKDSMGMDYIPVYAEEKSTAPGVAINVHKQQLIGVKKDVVKKRALAIEIATVGVVALKKATTQQDTAYVPATIGKAWIYMPVYEYEMGLLKLGQEVSIDVVAYPGVVFKGQVTRIAPVLSPESRSVRVRADVDDKEKKLKPEMFVNAKILVDLGEQLSIPEEALMDTGTRKIVYVVKDDHFAAREVTVGPKAGEFYEVLSGLNDGDEVVTSGNFLIDAESKLKGAQ